MEGISSSTCRDGSCLFFFSFFSIAFVIRLTTSYSLACGRSKPSNGDQERSRIAQRHADTM